MTRPLGFMKTSLYRKIIDEIADFAAPLRSREIELFHFGESLLHPQLDTMVELAANKGLNVALSVNAPQLSQDLADRLIGAGLARLIVSIDGHDEKSYRHVRGPAADYGRAVANIRDLSQLMKNMSRPPEVCLRIIRLKASEPFLDEFQRQWENCGIKVEIRPFFPWADPKMAALGQVEKYPPGMPCPFPWQYLVVQWDGTVVPCCRDYNAVNRIGNVQDQSLREIWNSGRYEAFRRQHRTGDYDTNDFCRQCMSIFYTEPPLPEGT
jgi:radical SAM protein with 4Fe4S-binding SPASM domain